ncbi:endonuclease/exonuclease/phosphatase family protein [Bacteroidota bacterium]
MKYIGNTILIYVTGFSSLFLLLSYLSVIFNPEIFWIAAFVGLAFPVFLTLNFLLLAFWIYKWKRITLVPFITLIIGWNVIARHFQFPRNSGSTSNEKTNSIKILSYNVRLFDYYNWTGDESANKKIFEFFDSEEPDIICLQEFLTDEKPNYSETYIKKKLNKYPYSHINYIEVNSGNRKYGIATFSKFPILKKGVFQFENTYNQCIYSDILIGGDTIRLYNNHLESIKFDNNTYHIFDKQGNLSSENEIKRMSSKLKQAFMKRAHQVNIISGHIQASPYEVIVSGDFNDTPVSFTYNEMRKNLKDAFLVAGKWFGNTYRGKLPAYRIDYIFTSKNFSIHEYRKYRVDYSDHYPISAVLEY